MWEYRSVDVPHMEDQPENAGALASYLEEGWEVVVYVTGGRRQFNDGTVEVEDRVLLKRKDR